jgi:1-aminocyclopropane-1-carboxylate deaminase
MNLKTTDPRFDLFSSKGSIKRIPIGKNFQLDIFVDYSFLTIGTKLRKAKGLEKELSQKKIQNICIFGNLHSNYLASFCIYFQNKGYSVKAYCYSYSGKTSLNQKIVYKYAQEINFFHNRKEMLECISQEKFKKQEYFWIPEFGVCIESNQGLVELWEEMGHNLFHVKHIFLDIGSGFTICSLLNYLERTMHLENKPTIYGVCIGGKENRLKKDLENIYNNLFHNNINKSNLQFILPESNSQFGRINLSEMETIKRFYEEHNLWLDPIYSAKSILAIESLVKEKNLEGRGLYLHQGGTSNHWRILSELSHDQYIKWIDSENFRDI